MRYFYLYFYNVVLASIGEFLIFTQKGRVQISGETVDAIAQRVTVKLFSSMTWVKKTSHFGWLHDPAFTNLSEHMVSRF